MKDNNTQSPKSKQFHEELQSLLDKYQYTLIAKIKTNENGIIPWIAISEVLPPKGNESKVLIDKSKKK